MKPRPLGSGICTYCGRFRPLTRDHVVLRSLLPGKLRDHPDNVLPACAQCNVGRGAGRRPQWRLLPARTQAFVLEHKGEIFARRYFREFDHAV